MKMPAFMVPSENRVSRMIFRKLAEERRLPLPDCVLSLIEQFFGWYYPSYCFQQAIDTATSPQGTGKIFLLRNITLVPVNCIHDVEHIYGVLRKGSLSIESLGGSWDIKLHRGGRFLGTQRVFILSSEECALSLKHFSIGDSLDYDVQICLHLTFREASKVGEKMPDTQIEHVSCKLLSAPRSTSSLTAFHRVGRDLSIGDQLVATKAFCLNSKSVYEGSKGVVTKTFPGSLDYLFSVEWSDDKNEKTLLLHKNRYYLDVSSTAEERRGLEGMHSQQRRPHGSSPEGRRRDTPARRTNAIYSGAAALAGQGRPERTGH
jgi:hypothetical protein